MTGIIGTCYATMTDRLTDEEKSSFIEMVGGNDVARQVIRGERAIKTILKNPTKGLITGGLLEEVGDLIELPATPIFSVREKFVENRDREVLISAVHGIAVDEFLEITEEHVPSAVLKRRKLLKRADNKNILAVFGAPEKARVAIAHVLRFLREADRIEWYHFFFDSLSMVVHWDGYGFDFEILPTQNVREWEEGSIIIAP